jgi:hypothetical protein
VRALPLALLLASFVAGCSARQLPPDVAPPQQATVRPVYQKTVPAPDVQPEPGNAFVRDARAESILAYIGSIEGRAGRADQEAREHAGQPDGCLAKMLVELSAVARQARARRAELRDAALEDPATEDRLFAELSGCAARAHQLSGQCSQLSAYRNGLEYQGRVKELESRVGGLATQMREPLRARSQEEVLVMEAGSIQLTGALAGAPATRQLRSFGRSLSALFASAPAKAGAPSPPPPRSAPAPTPAGPPVAAPAASPFAPAGPHDASMLLRSAQLTLAVFEVEKKMEAVQAVATELGGYLALRGDRELTVRVPRDHFDEALHRIEGVGDVLHRSIAAEDVTDQFVDLELRLKNALAVRARLEKLVETATVKDAVEIQKELARVTEEIERFEGKLKLLRDRIAFSTITVTFERTEPQRLKSQALLPFAWMRTMGLGPLLQVTR